METEEMKKKRPSWITTIAILCLIFSIIGIFAGVQDLFTPQTLNKQKEIIKTVEVKTIESNNKIKNKNTGPSISKEISQSMNELIEEPVWYEKWMFYNGIMKISLNLFQLYISISLLSIKPSAIPLFYIYIVLNILFRLTIFEVSINNDSILLFSDRVFSIFHIIISLAFLIIFIRGNKEILREVNT